MNKNFNSVYILALFLLLILFLTFSCKKKDAINRNPIEHSSSVTESTGNGKLVFGSTKAKQKSVSLPDNENNSLTGVDSMDIKGQLFPVRFMDIIPEDMDIGPLLDFNLLTEKESSFSSVVISFFMDAKKGLLNTKSLHPLYLENIKKMFSDELGKQSYSIRIGRIVEDKGIISADIRLINARGRVSGSVSADKLDDRWLISDLSINMKQLKEEYLNKYEFDPLSYSNILLNY